MLILVWAVLCLLAVRSEPQYPDDPNDPGFPADPNDPTSPGYPPKPDTRNAEPQYPDDPDLPDAPNRKKYSPKGKNEEERYPDDPSYQILDDELNDQVIAPYPPKKRHENENEYDLNDSEEPNREAVYLNNDFTSDETTKIRRSLQNNNNYKVVVKEKLRIHKPKKVSRIVRTEIKRTGPVVHKIYHTKRYKGIRKPVESKVYKIYTVGNGGKKLINLTLVDTDSDSNSDSAEDTLKTTKYLDSDETDGSYEKGYKSVYKSKVKYRPTNDQQELSKNFNKVKLHNDDLDMSSEYQNILNSDGSGAWESKYHKNKQFYSKYKANYDDDNSYTIKKNKEHLSNKSSHKNEMVNPNYLSSSEEESDFMIPKNGSPFPNQDNLKSTASILRQTVTKILHSNVPKPYKKETKITYPEYEIPELFYSPKEKVNTYKESLRRPDYMMSMPRLVNRFSPKLKTYEEEPVQQTPYQYSLRVNNVVSKAVPEYDTYHDVKKSKDHNEESSHNKEQESAEMQHLWNLNSTENNYSPEETEFSKRLHQVQQFLTKYTNSDENMPLTAERLDSELVVDSPTKSSSKNEKLARSLPSLRESLLQNEEKLDNISTDSKPRGTGNNSISDKKKSNVDKIENDYITNANLSLRESAFMKNHNDLLNSDSSESERIDEGNNSTILLIGQVKQSDINYTAKSNLSLRDSPANDKDDGEGFSNKYTTLTTPVDEKYLYVLPLVKSSSRQEESATESRNNEVTNFLQVGGLKQDSEEVAQDLSEEVVTPGPINAPGTFRESSYSLDQDYSTKQPVPNLYSLEQDYTTKQPVPSLYSLEQDYTTKQPVPELYSLETDYKIKQSDPVLNNPEQYYTTDQPVPAPYSLRENFETKRTVPFISEFDINQEFSNEPDVKQKFLTDGYYIDGEYAIKDNRPIERNPSEEQSNEASKVLTERDNLSLQNIDEGSEKVYSLEQDYTTKQPVPSLHSLEQDYTTKQPVPSLHSQEQDYTTKQPVPELYYLEKDYKTKQYDPVLNNPEQYYTTDGPVPAPYSLRENFLTDGYYTDEEYSFKDNKPIERNPSEEQSNENLKVLTEKDNLSLQNIDEEIEKVYSLEQDYTTNQPVPRLYSLQQDYTTKQPIPSLYSKEQDYTTKQPVPELHSLGKDYKIKQSDLVLNNPEQYYTTDQPVPAPYSLRENFETKRTVPFKSGFDINLKFPNEPDVSKKILTDGYYIDEGYAIKDNIPMERNPSEEQSNEASEVLTEKDNLSLQHLDKGSDKVYYLEHDYTTKQPVLSFYSLEQDYTTKQPVPELYSLEKDYKIQQFDPVLNNPKQYYTTDGPVPAPYSLRENFLTDGYYADEEYAIKDYRPIERNPSEEHSNEASKMSPENENFSFQHIDKRSEKVHYLEQDYTTKQPVPSFYSLEQDSLEQPVPELYSLEKDYKIRQSDAMLNNPEQYYTTDGPVPAPYSLREKFETKRTDPFISGFDNNQEFSNELDVKQKFLTDGYYIDEEYAIKDNRPIERNPSEEQSNEASEVSTDKDNLSLQHIDKGSEKVYYLEQDYTTKQPVPSLYSLEQDYTTKQPVPELYSLEKDFKIQQFDPVLNNPEQYYITDQPVPAPYSLRENLETKRTVPFISGFDINQEFSNEPDVRQKFLTDGYYIDEEYAIEDNRPIERNPSEEQSNEASEVSTDKDNLSLQNIDEGSEKVQTNVKRERNEVLQYLTQYFDDDKDNSRLIDALALETVELKDNVGEFDETTGPKKKPLSLTLKPTFDSASFDESQKVTKSEEHNAAVVRLCKLARSNLKNLRALVATTYGLNTDTADENDLITIVYILGKLNEAKATKTPVEKLVDDFLVNLKRLAILRKLLCKDFGNENAYEETSDEVVTKVNSDIDILSLLQEYLEKTGQNLSSYYRSHYLNKANLVKVEETKLGDERKTEYNPKLKLEGNGKVRWQEIPETIDTNTNKFVDTDYDDYYTTMDTLTGDFLQDKFHSYHDYNKVYDTDVLAESNQHKDVPRASKNYRAPTTTSATLADWDRTPNYQLDLNYNEDSNQNANLNYLDVFNQNVDLNHNLDLNRHHYLNQKDPNHHGKFIHHQHAIPTEDPYVDYNTATEVIPNTSSSITDTVYPQRQLKLYENLLSLLKKFETNAGRTSKLHGIDGASSLKYEVLVKEPKQLSGSQQVQNGHAVIKPSSINNELEWMYRGNKLNNFNLIINGRPISFEPDVEDEDHHKITIDGIIHKVDLEMIVKVANHDSIDHGPVDEKLRTLFEERDRVNEAIITEYIWAEIKKLRSEYVDEQKIDKYVYVFARRVLPELFKGLKSCQKDALLKLRYAKKKYKHKIVKGYTNNAF